MSGFVCWKFFLVETSFYVYFYMCLGKGVLGVRLVDVRGNRFESGGFGV